MLTPIRAPLKPGTAGGLVLLKATAAFDMPAACAYILIVSWENGNVFPTVDDLAVNEWIPTTRVYDTADGKGSQLFYCKRSRAAYANDVVTVRFSGTGCEFIDIIHLPFNLDGDYMVCTSEGVANIASTTTAFTFPTVTGADLLVGHMKAFSSVSLSSAASPVAPNPYGQCDDNTAAASRLFLSTQPVTGAVAASGTLSASANHITRAWAFTDVNAVQKALTYIPAWRQNATAGNCVKVPGASILDTGLNSNNGAAIVTAQTFLAYSGGIVSAKGMTIGALAVSGACMVMTGQGHTNGSGNEVFGYGPIQSEAPGFFRLRDNTLPVVVNTEFDGSSNPAASHTFATPVYDNTSGRNRMLRPGSVGRATDGLDISTAFYFDLDQTTPNVVQPYHQLTATTGGFRWSLFDTTSGLVFGYGGTGGTFKTYDVAADTVSSFTGKSTITTAGTAEWFTAWDSSRRIGLILARGNGNWWLLDTSSTGNDYTQPTPAGTPPTAGTFSGCCYDPVDDAFIVYIGTNQIYKLKNVAGTWTWSNSTYGGDTADTASSFGTYGRFAYINQNGLRGYLLINSYTSQAYFFIPTSATLPPVVSDPPEAVSIASGDKVYLHVGATQSPTYQWQDNRSGSFANCIDGTGATTADYTSTALTTGATGRQYRCVVTANSVSVNSAAAAITVLAATSGALGQFDADLRVAAWF